MSIYELPDGFEGMETAPKCAYGLCNVFLNNGHYGTSYPPFASCVIGWAPIVPPKKKRRFVPCFTECVMGPFQIIDNSVPVVVGYSIPTQDAAQAVADIYEKAYEVMP